MLHLTARGRHLCSCACTPARSGAITRNGLTRRLSAAQGLQQGTPASGLSLPPSSAAPTGRTTDRKADVVTAASQAADRTTLRTWSVEVYTHAPPNQDISKIGVQLTVISTEGDNLVFKDDGTEIRKYGRLRDDLDGRTDTFSITLPTGFEPAAVKVNDLEDEGSSIFQRKGKFERIFLRRMVLTPQSAAGSSSGAVHFSANSYISVQQDDRLFVRDDAWTNPDLKGNTVIAELQEKELQEIRGEGDNRKQAEKEARKPGDRIYRFAPYNDLGKDPKDKNNVRPTLGGSEEFPYPRRIDTNRPLFPNGAEQPPTESGILEPLVGDKGLLSGVAGRLLPSPWVPEDDNFSRDKSAGFIGTALVGGLPSAIDALGALFGDNKPGKEFDSISEVFSLYDPEQLNALTSGRGRDFGEGLAKLAEKVSTLTGEKHDNSSERFEPIDLVKYDAPRSLKDRLNTWQTDEEFGRMFFAGQNPMVVQAVGSPDACKQLLGSSTIKDTDIKSLLDGKSFAELAAEAQQGAEPRLFVVDYWALTNFLPEINITQDRVQHAGRAVLFRRSDGYVVPVAIELTDKQGAAPTVYTPNDPDTIWLVAKVIFMSIDSGWHQLISHFLRTHACTEPYLIAMRRQLSPTHPVFRLMLPHFRYTLPINAGARSLLIVAGGVIEENFTPGKWSLPLSSKVYGLLWQFKDEGLPADLKKRGFMSDAGELLVSDYPYAEDGLLVWTALHKYFTTYVDYYYQSDAEVAADAQLNAWWADVRAGGHPDKHTGWIELTGRASLVEILCTIAWVASAHHAAVNFGQYDNSGWMVTHSPLCRKAAPARGSTEWEALASLDVFSETYQEAYEKLMLSWLATPAAATKVMSTLVLLSAHAEDEQYLSAGADRMDYLPLRQDPKLAEIFNSFQQDISNVEAVINSRNDPNNNPAVLRNKEKDGMAYTLLLPSSGPKITSRGVPYSISI